MQYKGCSSFWVLNMDTMQIQTKSCIAKRPFSRRLTSDGDTPQEPKMREGSASISMPEKSARVASENPETGDWDPKLSPTSPLEFMDDGTILQQGEVSEACLQKLSSRLVRSMSTSSPELSIAQLIFSSSLKRSFKAVLCFHPKLILKSSVTYPQVVCSLSSSCRDLFTARLKLSPQAVL
jgi:hypothetical protein